MQLFALFDRGGTHEHWLTAVVSLFDLVYYRFKFLVFCFVDKIVVVFSDNRHVCRDRYYVKLVNLRKLGRLRLRRTRHAR